MVPGHVGVGLAFGRRVTEVAPAVDHLLGRAAADAELQASAADDVGRAGVLRHVQRVLVAHVDDRGADLDAPGPRADRGQQRERRAELARIVMDAEECAVRTKLLGGDRKLDRLQQRVGRRPHLRLRRRRPMAEREEADLFHKAILSLPDLIRQSASSSPAYAGAERGGVLATRQRPSLMPGEARLEKLISIHRLHPLLFSSFTKEEGRRNADKRWLPPPHLAMRHATCRARSSVGVPPRLSPKGVFHPKGSASGQASWDVV